MKLDVSDDDVFQEKTVPSGTMLAAGPARARTCHRRPVRHPSCVSEQHVAVAAARGDWAIFDKRYWPGDTLADISASPFAMSHRLLLLKRIFTAVPSARSSRSSARADRRTGAASLVSLRAPDRPHLDVRTRRTSPPSTCWIPKTISRARRACRSAIACATTCSGPAASARSSGAHRR